MVFTLTNANGNGTGGYIRIPAAIANQYKYLTLSGYSDGYYYYDSSYSLLTKDTKYLVSNYPCTDTCGFTTNGGGSSRVGTLTFSQS